MRIKKQVFCDIFLAKNALFLNWNKKSRKIKFNEFFNELKKLSENINQVKPEKIHIYIENLNSSVLDERNDEIIDLLVNALSSGKVKKIAITVGEKDLFKSFYAEQLIEEIKKKLEVDAKFFKNSAEAKKWL